MKFAIFFIIAVLTLTGVRYMFSLYPGYVEIDWLGYHSTLSIVTALICLLIIYIIIAAIYFVLQKIVNLPQFFSNYQQEKHHRKLNDQLWIAYQNIKFNTQPFPKKILLQLVKDNNIDHRIALDLLISQALTDREGSYAYINQLSTYPFTQPSCIYAEITMLNSMQKISESLKLYPKLISILPSPFIQDEYMALLISHAGQLIDQGSFEEAYGYLNSCDQHILFHQNKLLLSQYILLMSRYYMNNKQPKKAIKLIEQTWPNCQNLDLFDLYKLSFDTVDPQSSLNAAQRLASFSPSSLISFQIVIETALEARVWSVAKTTINQFHQFFPDHELSNIYRDKVIPYVND